MIKRVEIKGFRSCQDVVIDDLGGLTALIGRNASGKTTILKAVEWAARSATAPDYHRTSHAADPDRPVVVKAHLILKDIEYNYTIKQRFDFLDSQKQAETFVLLSEEIQTRSGNSRWTTLLKRHESKTQIMEGGKSTNVEIGLMTPALVALTSILPSHSSFLARVSALVEFLRTVRYYPLDEPNDSSEPSLIPEQVYQEWLTRFRATGDPGWSVSMRLLHLSKDQARFDELKGLLGADGLGIIDRIEVSKAIVGRGNIDLHSVEGPSLESNPDHNSILFFISFQQSRRSGGSREIVPHDRLSLGTRRLLRIIVSYVFDKSAVMLIEHPEDGIHFGLARKLIHSLRSGSDRVQTILTSHSTDVLNVMHPEEVRLVTMSEGATQVRALSEPELEAAANYIREEGTLTDFLRIVEED